MFKSPLENDLSELHAVAMDRKYCRVRHTYNFTRHYFLFGRDALIRSINLPPNGSLLEVGCGTARNLAKISSAYPGRNLFGVDISSQMLETAQIHLSANKLTRPIKLAQGDAATFDPETLLGASTFDRIIFSYSLSMIPAWETALVRAISMLEPEGQLMLVDFGDFRGFHSYIARLSITSLGRYQAPPRIHLLATLQKLAENYKLQLTQKFALLGFYQIATLKQSGDRKHGTIS